MAFSWRFWSFFLATFVFFLIYTQSFPFFLDLSSISVLMIYGERGFTDIMFCMQIAFFLLFCLPTDHICMRGFFLVYVWEHMAASIGERKYNSWGSRSISFDIIFFALFASGSNARLFVMYLACDDRRVTFGLPLVACTQVSPSAHPASEACTQVPHTYPSSDEAHHSIPMYISLSLLFPSIGQNMTRE